MRLRHNVQASLRKCPFVRVRPRKAWRFGWQGNACVAMCMQAGEHANASVGMPLTMGYALFVLVAPGNFTCQYRAFAVGSDRARRRTSG